MSPKAEVLTELDGLIAEGERIDGTYSVDEMGQYWSSLPEVDFHTLSTQARAAIVRVAGRDSEYYRSLPERLPNQVTFKNSGGSFVAAITGSLRALRRSVDAGLLISLESRLRANVYDDFLSQSGDLLAAGYHVASMVLIGGVLEDHLRKLCDTRTLNWTGSGSISKYNDLLRDNVYPQSVWRRIQTIADLRNDAAHGKGAALKVDDVEDAHRFVGRLLADYPA
jgi:hypothetical protein